MARVDRLTLDALGRNQQAAIRAMLDTFRRRGWRDTGAALAIVNALEDSDGAMTFRAAVKQVPDEFLARNELKRVDVEEALRDLVARR